MLLIGFKTAPKVLLIGSIFITTLKMFIVNFQSLICVFYCYLILSRPMITRHLSLGEELKSEFGDFLVKVGKVVDVFNKGVDG